MNSSLIKTNFLDELSNINPKVQLGKAFVVKFGCSATWKDQKRGSFDFLILNNGF